MSSAAGKDFVRIGDIVLLTSASTKSATATSEVAFSDGIWKNSVQLGDLRADNTLLQCCLFRVELCVLRAEGTMQKADKDLEAQASAQKIEECKDVVKFGMSVRLKHVMTGLCMGIDTLAPSEMVGKWDVVVSPESPQFSTAISLLSADKGRHRQGDDLEYGAGFMFAFQADALTYYTHVQDKLLTTSDIKGRWTFERPTRPLPDTADTVKMFNFLTITHQELDMVLGTDRTASKVVLLSNNDHPSTVWSIEPKDYGESATPVGEVYLKNIASQKYLSSSPNEEFTLTELPEMTVHIKVESTAGVEPDTLAYEQPFRIVLGSTEMLSVDTKDLKGRCISSLVVLQNTGKDRKQQLEVRRVPKKKTKDAMFYCDTLDQEECRKMNLIARANLLLQRALKEMDGILEAGVVQKQAVSNLMVSQHCVLKVVSWLELYITGAPLLRYLPRRQILVSTNIHITLSTVCSRLAAISKMMFSQNEDGSNASEKSDFTVAPTIQSITKLLSLVAKANRTVATEMAKVLPTFEELRTYGDESVYRLVTSVMEKTHPLSAKGEILPFTQGKRKISEWLSGLLPMSHLTKTNVYHQSTFLYLLRVCCYDNEKFMPWVGKFVFSQLQEKKRLPLMTLRMYRDGDNPEFLVGPKGLSLDSAEEFLRNNGSLHLSEEAKREGDAMLCLSEIANLPAYRDYVYNYLMLVSALSNVWTNDPATPLGFEPTVCVQLAKQISLSKFGSCGLRLMTALVLKRQKADGEELLFTPREKVNPDSMVGNNCYYPARCQGEPPEFKHRLSNSSEPQILEIVDFVTRLLFTRAQPVNQINEDVITYLAVLLDTISDLIVYGHVTRLFFFAMERFFPYFLQGFAQTEETTFYTWVSNTLSLFVNSDNSEARSVVERCYRSMMYFGISVLKTKRSFQLESLTKAAISSRSEANWSWEAAIAEALETNLMANAATFAERNAGFEAFTNILENAPGIKSLLYSVVLMRSDLASWMSEKLKTYVECIYGEAADLLHLLCKAELLEDFVVEGYQKTLNEIIKNGHIDDLVNHFNIHGSGKLISPETLSQCVESLQSLCALIHPLNPNDIDATSYRSIMRHLQIQLTVYKLWQVAFENKESSQLTEVMKYCVQFFYNFAYGNAINERELKKIFVHPMYLTTIPQLVDLLKILGRFETLSTRETIEIIDGILDKRTKQNLQSLYFIEVLMFDSQNRPNREVQNYVMKAIIEIADMRMADVEQNMTEISAILRLISLACEGNGGMASQADVLLARGRFEQIARYGNSPRLLKATCDFISTVWSSTLQVHQAQVAQLLKAALIAFDDKFFRQGPNTPDLSLLQEIAVECNCSLLFTDPAAMTVREPFCEEESVEVLQLVCSKSSGVLAMLRKLFRSKQELSEYPEIEALVSDLNQRLSKLKEAIISLKDSFNCREFLSAIETFWSVFSYTESEVQAGKLQIGQALVKMKLNKGAASLALQTNSMFKQSTNVMSCLISCFYEHYYKQENATKDILSSVWTLELSESDTQKIVAASRAFLRNSEDKMFYFNFIKFLIQENSDNVAIYIVENKVAIDAVKATIYSNLENRLFALDMLLTLLRDRDASFLTRFREVLERSELAVDLFESLNSVLAETTLEQASLYRWQQERKSTPTRSTSGLIKLEFAMKVLEFLLVLCDMCNEEFQLYLLRMPQSDRGSILHQATRLLMTLNKNCSVLEAKHTDYSLELLSRCNAFYLNKATRYMSYMRAKFEFKEIDTQRQPSYEEEREMLTKKVLDVVNEAITGPCALTQAFVGSSATLYLSFNHILSLAWKQRNVELYDASITVLLSLLDGEPDSSTLLCISTYLKFSILIDHLRSLHHDITASENTSQVPIENLKQTGTKVFMLLLKRRYLPGSTAVEALRTFHLDNENDAYYEYFIKRVGYVEIAAPGASGEMQVKSVYFPIPDHFQYLTLESKNELLFDVDRSDQKSQIHDFLQREEIWLLELDHQQNLRSTRLSQVTQHWVQYGWIAYWLVVGINLLLLFKVRSTNTLYGLENETHSNSWLLTVITVLGVLQLAISMLHVASYLTEFFPNVFMRIGFQVNLRELSIKFRRKQSQAEDERTRLKTVSLLWAICTKTNCLYYICYFAVSLFALRKPFVYPFLLLDIVLKSSDLVTILQSITKNLSQLVLTVCLATIWIYIFSVFGYVYLQRFYSDEVPCSNLWDCFTSTFSKGVQSGGGIGDVLSPAPSSDPLFWGRFAFDLTYFIIIIVVLLNVIFGIILDTFGQLRDERNERSQDIASTCYICGEQRSNLELKGNGWKYHFTGEHSPFAYLAFLIYLDRKDTRTCNGMEKYVKDKKEKMDHTFIPNKTQQQQNYVN